MESDGDAGAKVFRGIGKGGSVDCGVGGEERMEEYPCKEGVRPLHDDDVK